jgi:hypothetical protein
MVPGHSLEPAGLPVSTELVEVRPLADADGLAR